MAAIDTCQSLTSMRNVTVLLEERDLQRQAEKEKQMAEKKQKEEAKSREIITKYGEFYGKMILQNKLVTGMTKAMVNEVWPKEFFNHGKTIYRDLCKTSFDFRSDRNQAKEEP